MALASAATVRAARLAASGCRAAEKPAGGAGRGGWARPDRTVSLGSMSVGSRHKGRGVGGRRELVWEGVVSSWVCAAVLIEHGTSLLS
jgi:hypothetical protein